MLPVPVRFASILILLAAGAVAEDWKPLFDGRSLGAWKETAFRGKAPVKVENGTLILSNGQPLTGITFTGTFPGSNYEIRFEAMKQNGPDFFASLTFPVKESFATLVTGGWGGDIVGISSIDGWDASENETRNYVNFENGRWYKFRLEVRDERIAAWIDEDRVVNVNIAGRKISLRPGDIQLSAPLGFASYNSTGVLRNIEFRSLQP